MADRETWIIEAWNGKRWAKVRGEGPFTDGRYWKDDEEIIVADSGRKRAERAAKSREALPRRTSSTEGMPHRTKRIS